MLASKVIFLVPQGTLHNLLERNSLDYFYEANTILPIYAMHINVLELMPKRFRFCTKHRKP